MFKKSRILPLLILTMIIFTGCSNAPEEVDKVDSDYKKISAEEAKDKITNNEEVIIVDVRTLEEYNEEHIANAILIPNETIIDTPPELLPDFDAEILIYCRSGNRSEQASRKLIEMGYTNVYDFGGIIDWPYETVN